MKIPGLIFETEFDSGADHMFTHNLEKYCKQLIHLKKGSSSSGSNANSGPITGLEYHRVNISGSAKHYFALATTPDRLYQFRGQVNDPDDRPLLTHVFMNNPQQNFLELPSTVKYSTLAYFHRPKDTGKVLQFI